MKVKIGSDLKAADKVQKYANKDPAPNVKFSEEMDKMSVGDYALIVVMMVLAIGTIAFMAGLA